MAVDAKTGQPIFHGATSVGLRSVGSYQVSGWPHLTGGVIPVDGEVRIDWPWVTKSITVAASSSTETMTGDLRVHFCSTASSTNVLEHHHYWSLSNHEDALTMDIKTTRLFLSTVGATAGDDVGFQIMAEMTQIPSGSMWEITGSGHTDVPFAGHGS